MNWDQLEACMRPVDRWGYHSTRAADLGEDHHHDHLQVRTPLAHHDDHRAYDHYRSTASSG
jgi:hypothetical protein